MGSPELSPQEGAVGSQESGGTINAVKHVPNEGRINFLPSHSLVGAPIGLAPIRSESLGPTSDSPRWG